MTTLLQDLRYALRQMRQAPGFALSVVIVLALGIGANAAMFTVLEGTLFRPLPYTGPGQLVLLHTTTAQSMLRSWSFLPDLLVWQQRTRLLSQIAYFDSNASYLHSRNAEQKVSSVSASSNLFVTLGVMPALGRSFSAQEQQPGKEHVAVLSDSVWRTQFQADRHILGQTVLIDDTPTTIIGVMPAGFVFPANETAAQIWVPSPLTTKDFTRTFDAASYQVIARRRSGSSIAAAANELTAIQKQLVPLYNPKDIPASIMPTRIVAVDYQRSLDAKNQHTALLALLGAVAALWLIACANVACLMLARAASRRREIAVRAALGASRWRLVRQTLTESLLLSLTGGALGLALSQITLHLFHHSLKTQLSSNLSLHPDGRVLFALLALSVLSAMLFGIIPSRLASSIPVDQVLRQDGAQAGTGRHQHRLQRILVVSELSLTLAMLVSCGLLLRTVFALRHVPLGFRTEHVFVIEPHLPDYKYENLDPNALVYKPLLNRIKAVPGVQSAALTTIVPLEKGYDNSLSIYMDKDKPITAKLRAAGPEYQEVLGFGMARGRYFSAQDTSGSQLEAIVNRAFAKLYEHSDGDVGKFSMSIATKGGAKPRPIKIIGVIDDFHQAGIADPAAPELEVNAAQLLPADGFYQSTLGNNVELVLRSSRDPRSLIPELNHVMQQLNPDLAGTGIRTMDQIVDDAMGSQILAAHLLEALGGLALLVALAGLYSLLAYLVTLRTRELGLRLALGAQREDILILVLRGAGVLLLSGTAIGIGISLLTARLLHSFLFGVKQYDALILIGASTLLLFVGAFAAWLPARRAASLEPMQALRTE